MYCPNQGRRKSKVISSTYCNAYLQYYVTYAILSGDYGNVTGRWKSTLRSNEGEQADMPEEYESKRIQVKGDEHFKEYAKTHPVPPAYERWIHARTVTFTCVRCKQEVTEVRFPGPTRYCAACAAVVKREKTRLRVQAARQRKKAVSETDASSETM